MGVGVSLLLIAAGAILTWAVSAETSALPIGTATVFLILSPRDSRASPMMPTDASADGTSTWITLMSFAPPTSARTVPIPAVELM